MAAETAVQRDRADPPIILGQQSCRLLDSQSAQIPRNRCPEVTAEFTRDVRFMPSRGTCGLAKRDRTAGVRVQEFACLAKPWRYPRQASVARPLPAEGGNDLEEEAVARYVRKRVVVSKFVKKPAAKQAEFRSAAVRRGIERGPAIAEVGKPIRFRLENDLLRA